MLKFNKEEINILLCSRTVNIEKKDFTWGAADYSYAVVLNRFYEFFKRNGFKVRVIDDSRIYHHDSTLSGLEKRNLVHIAIQAPDKAKIMPNAYNICSFAWEFDSKTHKKFLNNLEKFDELWPTSYQAYNFLKKNIKKKSIIIKKVQIPLGNVYLKDVQATSNEEAFDGVDLYNIIYDEETVPTVTDINKKGFIFSLFNPWDGRKHFDRMIDIFLDKKNKAPEILVLKLSINNKDTKWKNILGILTENYRLKNVRERLLENNKQIFLITQKISDIQLISMYKNSKFVWYTSRCEGTNLPVVEALVSGANVVTPVHTGIEDYLDSDYPLKIESKPVFMTEKWINLYGFKLKDGDRLPVWYKVSRKSNLEFLNNFRTHLLKNKNSNVKYKVKKYFSDEEVIKAIKS